MSPLLLPGCSTPRATTPPTAGRPWRCSSRASTGRRAGTRRPWVAAGPRPADERQHIGALLTRPRPAAGAAPVPADFFAAKGDRGSAARGVARRVGGEPCRRPPAPGARRRCRPATASSAGSASCIRWWRGWTSAGPVPAFELDFDALAEPAQLEPAYGRTTFRRCGRTSRRRGRRRPAAEVWRPSRGRGDLLRRWRCSTLCGEQVGEGYKSLACGSSSARPTARSPTSRWRSAAPRSSGELEWIGWQAACLSAHRVAVVEPRATRVRCRAHWCTAIRRLAAVVPRAATWAAPRPPLPAPRVRIDLENYDPDGRERRERRWWPTRTRSRRARVGRCVSGAEGRGPVRRLPARTRALPALVRRAPGPRAT